jgi:DNA-binding GntR family transcriptional regulator
MKRRASKTNPPKPLVSKVADFLVGEILSDRLRPNQKISELAVAEKLGVSRSPVREALRILERDGLVTYEPGKGVHVTDIKPEDAEELHVIHGHLMGLAVKLACQKMTMSDVAGLEKMVRSLKSAAAKQDRSEFLDVRALIEKCISEHSVSPRLAHLLEVMGYPSARYRAFHVSVPGYMENVAACYDGIVQAFRHKDQARAEKLRVQIIDKGMELLRRYFIEPAAQPEERKRIASG